MTSSRSSYHRKTSWRLAYEILIGFSIAFFSSINIICIYFLKDREPSKVTKSMPSIFSTSQFPFLFLKSSHPMSIQAPAVHREHQKGQRNGKNQLKSVKPSPHLRRFTLRCLSKTKVHNPHPNAGKQEGRKLAS